MPAGVGSYDTAMCGETEVRRGVSMRSTRNGKECNCEDYHGGSAIR